MRKINMGAGPNWFNEGWEILGDGEKRLLDTEIPIREKLRQTVER